jgi:putative oxidoreductase
MAGHGSQKLFGWFGGYGLAGTAGFFESIGFRRGAGTCAHRPGLFSLDALLGLGSLCTPTVVWTAITVGIVLGFVNLGLRRVALEDATA